MSVRAAQLTVECIFGGLVLLIVLFYLWIIFGFSVVQSTRPATATIDPAIKVEISTTRDGHITERHLSEGTFYDYRGA